MNSNGPADPPDDNNSGDETGKTEPSSRPGGQSDRARQVFGTKGGGRPWDARQDPDESSLPMPKRSHPTASAPYADAATHAPRAQVEDVPDDELTRLHPNYKLLMRIGAIVLALVICVAGIVLDLLARTEIGFPFGVIQFPAFAIALFIAIRVPLARYNARGYQMSDDRLRVVRGVLFRSDTIVPFGRVQHIDVDQSPIERMLDIATMTLHTAGSHNASVRLAGLGHERAIAMREEIRAHIKRESM